MSQYAHNQPAGFTNAIRRVAIVGSGGSVGKPIAQELLKTGKHTVIGLTRAGSQSTLPSGVQPVPVDYNDEDSVVTALKDVDALIITLAVRTPPEIQSLLIQAAAKAGVKYIMPNVWGNDIMNEPLTRAIPTWDTMHGALDEIERAGASWIVLSCGFWYDHSVVLGPSGFGFDFEKKKMTFFDEGKTRINISSLVQCGRAVASLLSLKVLPEDESDQEVSLSRWRNKPVYISSWMLCQEEMFESWKRVAGEEAKEWVVEYESSEERYKRGMGMLKQGDFSGFPLALYSRVFFPNGDGDFESKYGLANEVLGLPVEDLDEQTTNAKAMVERGYNYMTNRN